MAKLVEQMGEELREVVGTYYAVREVTRTDVRYKNDPKRAEAWLARVEREVMLKFYLQAVGPYKGELSSTVIEQAKMEANEFIQRMKETEAVSVEKVLATSPC